MRMQQEDINVVASTSASPSKNSQPTYTYLTSGEHQNHNKNFVRVETPTINSNNGYQFVTIDPKSGIQMLSDGESDGQTYQLVALSPGGSTLIPIENGEVSHELLQQQPPPILQPATAVSAGSASQQSQFIIVPSSDNNTTSNQFSGTIQMVQSGGDGGESAQSNQQLQVLNLGDGQAFIPIGNSPFFQIASPGQIRAGGSGNGISTSGVTSLNGATTSMGDGATIGGNTDQSGTITLSAQQYSQLTNSQGGVIEIMSQGTVGHGIDTHHTTASVSSAGSQNGAHDGTLIEDGGVAEIAESGEEPIYVNAKQYNRILIRRAARARLEAQGRIPKERRKYMHESRHRHALKRTRGDDGKYHAVPGENSKMDEEGKTAS